MSTVDYFAGHIRIRKDWMPLSSLWISEDEDGVIHVQQGYDGPTWVLDAVESLDFLRWWSLNTNAGTPPPTLRVDAQPAYRLCQPDVYDAPPAAC